MGWAWFVLRCRVSRNEARRVVSHLEHHFPLPEPVNFPLWPGSVNEPVTQRARRQPEWVWHDKRWVLDELIVELGIGLDQLCPAASNSEMLTLLPYSSERYEMWFRAEAGLAQLTRHVPANTSPAGTLNLKEFKRLKEVEKTITRTVGWKRSSRGIAIARRSIASPSNAPPCARTSISNTSESSVSDIIVAGFPQIGQINDSSGSDDELFLDGQVGIVAPTVAGMTGLRASFLRGRRDLLGIEQIVGAVAASRLLRLTAKEFVLQGADLAARLVKLLLQLLDPFDGVSMLAFPIAHFATELTPQLANARSNRCKAGQFAQETNFPASRSEVPEAWQS